MVKLLLGVIFQTWELQHVRATFESIFPLQDIFFPASLFVATGGVGTFLHLSLGLRRHSSRWWITIHLTTLLGSVPWLIEEWQDVMEKCDRTSGWISFWEVCGLMSKYDVSWGDLHKLMDVSRNWKATHGEIMVKNEPWPCINAASHKPLRFWGEPLTKSQGQGLWMVCLYGFEWSDSCIEREREMIVIV